MSLDELKLPQNNLFKLTCRDGHDTPNYTFSWELTSQGADILKKEEVRFPFLYILAVEEIPPNKVESHASGCGCKDCAGHVRVVEDELFCLHEGAGIIQFHRQGTFRIYAMVIWASDKVLDLNTWKTHRNYTVTFINSYKNVILKGANLPDWALQHIEEDAVTVTPSFFARKPNPILWWWANLWWEGRPRNSCDYKKRLLFLLWLQIPIVSIYVALRGLFMALSYPGLLLIGYRPSSFSFRPMFHPFSSIFKQLCDFDSRTSNYATQNSKGNYRPLIRDVLVRLPLFWIGAPILTYYSSRSVYHNPMLWGIAGGVTLGIAVFIAAIVGLVNLRSRVKNRRQPIEVYYELIPVEKHKKQRVPVKTRWIDAKGKLCLPYPE